ncbi:hypothetical protein [Sinomonas atrocyanea]
MEEIAGHDSAQAVGTRRRYSGVRLVVLGVVFAVFGLVVPSRPNLALLAGVLMIVAGSIAVRVARGLLEREKEGTLEQLRGS